MTDFAKYSGPCAHNCGRTIRKGQVIEFIKVNGNWKPVHEDCEPPGQEPPEVCEKCFMAKASNGTCGC